MNPAGWQLEVPDDFRRRLAATWLIFGATALLISGLFVILILLSRTPGLQVLFPVEGFFQLALVVHVDFSVLLWFATLAAMFWTLASTGRGLALGWLAVGLSVAGALSMAVAPFRPGDALMSNYIPVVHNTAFLGGLALFGTGLLLAALRTLIFPQRAGTAFNGSAALYLGSQSAAFCVVIAVGSLCWTWLALPEALEGVHYFEILFWGGGHIVQFAWTQLMLVAWLWLASASGLRIPLSPRLVAALILAGALPALLALWGYIAHDIGSPQHRTFFIWLMAAGGGVAAGPIGLGLLAGWRASPAPVDATLRGLRSALWFSILLFGVGGILGFVIGASNTIIPAHYHGSIVAVTLAFMGIALHLLPAFGFGRPSPTLVRVMPWVYGTGQLMHVAGLAFSGGRGVQRKTAGAAQQLDSLPEVVGMVVMGVGGFVAVIGGILFLLAVIGTVRRRGGTA